MEIVWIDIGYIQSIRIKEYRDNVRAGSKQHS